VTLRVTSPFSLPPGPTAPPVMPGASNDLGPNGTYPYDGGPMAPVPMPRPDESPARALPPRITSPGATERVVSLQLSSPVANKGKWIYPAYGEEPRRTGR
jgi:hypothetical protein